MLGSRALMTLVSVTLFVSPLALSQNDRTLVESRESLYNNIYVYRQGNLVSMTFGYNRTIYTESAYNTTDDLDLPVVYTQLMTASLIYPKNINSILEIGFGGGRTSSYLHRSLPDVDVTSVELDPAVVDLARKYFGVREDRTFHVVTSDGRLFLANTDKRYDIILIDAYRGPFVPFHLLTKEFYALVKSHLTNGGVVAQNIEPSTMLFDSAVKTIHAEFSQLDFYMADGNVVTIAYSGAPRGAFDLDRVARQRQAAFKLRYDLVAMAAHRRQMTELEVGALDPKARVLTDDFAPVESLKAIQRHNTKWPNQ